MGRDFWENLRNYLKRSRRTGLSKKKLFVTFVILCLPGFFISPNLSTQIKQWTLDGSVAVLNLLEKPVETVNIWSSSLGFYFNQQKHLEHLNEKAKTLDALANRLTLLEQENLRLKELLSIPKEQSAPICTTRCVGKVLQGEYHVLYVQAGSRQGIQVGQPVLAQNALIGIVEDVGLYSARILLTSDPSFQIPVRTLESQSDGILAGNGLGQLQLSFLQDSTTISPAETVVSSGIGGVFPPDLLLGHTYLQKNGDVHVVPPLELKDISFVQILLTPQTTKSPGEAHD